MSADGVAVKGNENDIPQDSWDDNQPSERVRTGNGLAVDEEVVLPSEMRLAEACTIAGVELCFLKVLARDSSRVIHKTQDGCRLAIVLVRLGPFLRAGEAYAHCAVKERLDAGGWGCNLMWLKDVEIA